MNASFIIYLLIFAICLSLAVGLWAIVRDKPGSTRPLKSLSLRILLSLLLFSLIALGMQLGWLHPHGLAQ